MMQHSPDAPARRAAIALAEEMAGFWQRRPGGDLLGAYLIGSLAHGGFSRRYSDIDMLVLSERGVNTDDQQAMRAAAAAAARMMAT